jgi:hypothetical protein
MRPFPGLSNDRVVVWEEWLAQVSWPQLPNGEALRGMLGMSRSEIRKAEFFCGAFQDSPLIPGCTCESFSTKPERL